MKRKYDTYLINSQKGSYITLCHPNTYSVKQKCYLHFTYMPYNTCFEVKYRHLTYTIFFLFIRYVFINDIAVTMMPESDVYLDFRDTRPCGLLYLIITQQLLSYLLQTVNTA